MNQNEQHNHKPNPYTNKNPFQKRWTEKREFKPPQTPFVKPPNAQERPLANKTPSPVRPEITPKHSPYVRRPQAEPAPIQQAPTQPSSSSRLTPQPGEILISPTPQASTPKSGCTPSAEQKALLLYLLQMKFMTMDQIDRKFFRSQSMAQNFRSLLAHGYLKTKSEELSSESLIVPTEKAYDLLKLENPEKEIPKHIKRVFEPAIKHDLKLVELRMRFEELNFIKNWYSERSLAEIPLMNRLFQDLPDAICKKPNEKGYFLELEISPKNRGRYEERIRLYQDILQNQEVIEQGLEGVIFLCTEEKVCETLRSITPKTKAFSVLMLERYLKPAVAAS